MNIYSIYTHFLQYPCKKQLTMEEYTLYSLWLAYKEKRVVGVVRDSTLVDVLLFSLIKNGGNV